MARLALRLFDQLKNEHGLDDHSRLLLEIAAILHDVGTYIKTSGHHKHGQYLVANSEIFGLHGDDISIVSKIVRYHRKTMPLSSHSGYMSLSREERVKVLKLAALIRVADALDRGHMQRIRDISVERAPGELHLVLDYKGDISVERYGLGIKGDMFEEVFGMEVVLSA